ncbi:MAG TPA: hypothetical protein VNX68_14775, partial [Nitrosopumilaceae archaeon]|nr:hypothetical protein [Nitrosopumilaceae archaeon]
MVKKCFKILLAVYCFQFANLKAQTSPDIKRTKHWYFGTNAGLDYSGGVPVAVTNGQLQSLISCASISDTSGQFLFYSDGMRVWNKNNQLMSNGTGLNGDYNGRVLIVPKPLNDSLYYVFTTRVNPAPYTGFQYSIVNMKLQGGLGDVIVKNDTVLKDSWERLAAVKHANGTDIWIAVIQMNTNNIYCYLLTATGLSASPVINSIGNIDNFGSLHFCFSASGKKLAMTANQTGSELFDFNTSTGILSNPIIFPAGGSSWEDFGVEFSPDETKLYFTREPFGPPTLLYQVDLMAGSPTNIINSLTLIDTISKSTASAIQRAADGKLYVGRFNYKSLGRINNPNALGKSCNFDTNAISLNGKICSSGFPLFISSYFYDPSLLSGIEAITNKIETKIYPNPSVTGVFYT